MERAAAVVTPPDFLRARPEAKKVRSKTIFAGNRRRRRWRDPDGTIYEWDYQHGTVEVYDRYGRHLGEINPDAGERISGPVATRRVEP